MNLVKWLIYLIFVSLACSKSSTTPATPEPIIEGPYRVTALLNDSTWFGSTYASKTLPTHNPYTPSACTSNGFDLNLTTDLPYNNSSSIRPVTGCSGKCIPTQIMRFQNIPLAIGRYEIVTLNSCAADSRGAVEYIWLLGGDGIINQYNSQNSKLGWIEVTGYNSRQNAVEGVFELELAGQTSVKALGEPTPQRARFQNGAFKALVN